jgi:hypothetical protein
VADALASFLEDHRAFTGYMDKLLTLPSWWSKGDPPRTLLANIVQNLHTQYAGREATEEFFLVHDASVLKRHGPELSKSFCCSVHV